MMIKPRHTMLAPKAMTSGHLNKDPTILTILAPHRSLPIPRRYILPFIQLMIEHVSRIDKYHRYKPKGNSPNSPKENRLDGCPYVLFCIDPSKDVETQEGYTKQPDKVTDY